MRSQLRFVDLDQRGNPRDGRSVEVFAYGTTTPIANTMYPTPVSSTVLNPNTLVTSTLGEFEAWIDGLSAPVTIRIGGASGTTETVYFVPDPATLALATSTVASILTSTGDIIVATAPSVGGRLGIGTGFQELVVNAGATALQWASGVLARVTTAGDIVQATGANAIARLAIGTARQNLQVNAGATALTYADSIQALIQAAGDLIVGSAANTAARLAKGTNGQYLGVVGGVLTWTTGTAVRNVVSSAVGVTSGPTQVNATYDDITDMSAAITTTGGDIVAWFQGSFFHSTVGLSSIAFSLDGAAEVGAKEYTEPTANYIYTQGLVYRWVGLPGGSYTVKVRWKTSAPTLTGRTTERDLVVIET